jgi:hypothetical protein
MALGRLHSYEGAAQNKAESLRWFRLAADQGNAEAKVEVADIYRLFFRSYGVKPNEAEALKYYRLAANQGNANAEFQIGNMYLLGEGMKRDSCSTCGQKRNAMQCGWRSDCYAHRRAEVLSESELRFLSRATRP